MTNKPKYPKRGRPVMHPPVVNEKTGEIFATYTEAAVACNGDRSCVRRVCEGLLRKHKGCKFRFVKKDELGRKFKGITLIELIVGITIIVILGFIFAVGIHNQLNKIDHGEVVDKEYHAGYSYYTGKNGCRYNPEKFELTIQGEKNGKVVEYTFTVPETEYYMYDIGDNYPKG